MLVMGESIMDIAVCSTVEADIDITIVDYVLCGLEGETDLTLYNYNLKEGLPIPMYSCDVDGEPASNIVHIILCALTCCAA